MNGKQLRRTLDPARYQFAEPDDTAVIDAQIETIKRILAKKAHPNARTISVKKIEAELAELERKAAEHAMMGA